jgi:hypothetical protein
MYYIADTENCRIRMVTDFVKISTVAGTGLCGYNGDNIQATSAKINNPTSIFVILDTIYIADTFNHRIRVMTIGGKIQTLAGTGKQGFFGDNGYSLSAQFYNPTSIFMDGTIAYITDTGNNRIRKISFNGIIYTIAGSGKPNFRNDDSGDGNLATSVALLNPVSFFKIDKTIYFADMSHNRIRKLTGCYL